MLPAFMIQCSSYLWLIRVVKEASIVVKGLSVRCLLLLSSRSAGAVDSLLDLSGDTVLGSVELGTDGTVLGEGAADLLDHVSRDSQ